MADIRVCSAAETEFTEALCWYADRNASVALEFDADFAESLSRIIESPERYPSVDDRHRFYLMRRFPFQIIYRWADATVTVIAVAHTSRKPEYWTGR